MYEQICPFCGGNASEPDHLFRCDGRQGHIEAEIDDEPGDRDPIWPEYDPASHARTTDPDTSHAAALAVDATEVQRRVYAIFADHPDGLTDEELLEIYARQYPAPRSVESYSSPRKRRSDLTRAGIVVDTGTRRVLTSGRNGVVWSLARVTV